VSGAPAVPALAVPAPAVPAQPRYGPSRARTAPASRRAAPRRDGHPRAIRCGTRRPRSVLSPISGQDHPEGRCGASGVAVRGRRLSARTGSDTTASTGPALALPRRLEPVASRGFPPLWALRSPLTDRSATPIGSPGPSRRGRPARHRRWCRPRRLGCPGPAVGGTSRSHQRAVGEPARCSRLVPSRDGWRPASGREQAQERAEDL
jgi:hypothetical protein